MCNDSVEGRAREDREAAQPLGFGAAAVQAESPLVRFHVEQRKSETVARTPLFIRIALDLYVNPESAAYLYAISGDLSPQRDVFQSLIDAGILERVGKSVRVCAHDALRIYVDALTAVPLPRKRWVMP